MTTTCYYFDTNALYAFYRKDMRSLFNHPDYKHYAELSSGLTTRRLTSNETVYVSNLTYLEFLGRLLRHERKEEIKKKDVNSILERLEKDIGKTKRHKFQLISTVDNVFSYARTLLLENARRNSCALDTNDAIHIAIAKLMEPEVILVTSDGGKRRGDTAAKMKCVCERIGLAYFDPEQEII